MSNNPKELHRNEKALLDFFKEKQYGEFIVKVHQGLPTLVRYVGVENSLDISIVSKKTVVYNEGK